MEPKNHGLPPKDAMGLGQAAVHAQGRQAVGYTWAPLGLVQVPQSARSATCHRGTDTQVLEKGMGR